MSSKNNALLLQLNSIKLPNNNGRLDKISYQCASSFKIFPIHRCSDGLVSFKYLNVLHEFNLNGWFDFALNQWEIELSSLSKALIIKHNSKKNNTVSIQLNHMPIDEFVTLTKDTLSLNTDTLDGNLTAEFELNLNEIFSMTGEYKFENFDWESEDSEYVLANTQINGSFVLRPVNHEYELLNSLSIISGEGLAKDIYLVFEKDMFTINSVLGIDKEFEMNGLAINLALTDAINIDVEVLDIEKQTMNIQYDIQDMSLMYQKYLKSYLSIIGISKVEVDGEIAGELKINSGAIQSVHAVIKSMFMEIESKKIEVNNLNSTINWHNKEEVLTSNFSWDALLLAGMPINQSELQVFSSGQELSVKNNSKIPIFDGSIDINRLEMKDIFEPEINIKFDGEVQPISLSLITEKMGWPVMKGNISGKIPGMNKTGDVITFDGILELSVFNGTMTVKDLSIERLFGIAPVIAADITFQDISLLQLTSTYDFGDITGNVNGFINRMRITNWKADRLDAYIESQKVKGVKQLISQRAIDNISSIGGVQGALSRSFLSFFDAFRYKKIGIGCKLRNSICEMKGLKNSTTNYQIVAGQGLPSINIFGYRNYIDWQIFLDRLLNASY
ncbi:MAG: hypothetical protein AB8B80_00635 [Marinicellaceae bacterium]